jgi:hypothetical protein
MSAKISENGVPACKKPRSPGGTLVGLGASTELALRGRRGDHFLEDRFDTM